MGITNSKIYCENDTESLISIIDEEKKLREQKEEKELSEKEHIDYVRRHFYICNGNYYNDEKQNAYKIVYNYYLKYHNQKSWKESNVLQLLEGMEPLNWKESSVLQLLDGAEPLFSKNTVIKKFLKECKRFDEIEIKNKELENIRLRKEYLQKEYEIVSKLNYNESKDLINYAKTHPRNGLHDSVFSVIYNLKFIDLNDDFEVGVLRQRFVLLKCNLRANLFSNE